METSVAIVGMGCRLPGAPGIEAFWDLLTTGGDAVTTVPSDRFDIDALHAPAPGTPGRTVSRHGGFLTDVYGFDASFFGISPVEAHGMDPQQRLLLHVVWEALEAAGIRPSSLAGTRGGVFVGQATAEYAETGPPAAQRGVHDVTGNRIRAVTSGRISYALDLRGPSVVIDTACSSSLVAVHAARQSLLTGDSDLAIAGGVNVILSPDDAVAYSQGAMLSPGGRCRFGDADGDGFVRSEGIAAIVLKRLPDALRDGDPVLALLAGSAVTNDGAASGLLLRPSVEGQEQMLREACRSAGITPGMLDYVEAHGTGTSAGDRVELQALAAAVAEERSTDRPLLTGSVKTNIGHTEAAAGLAGLIKAVLIARHGTIPASLHLDRPHPLLADGRLPVEVVREQRPLNRTDRPSFVGVSSFGLSGTNAHAVISTYAPAAEPAATERAQPRRPHLLVLSARTRAALLRLAAAHADHLEGPGRARQLSDICATAALRRDAHPSRLWVVGETHEDLTTALRALVAGERPADGGFGDAGVQGTRDTVFVFPGQGSQWLGMGRGLYASSPAFRAALDACDQRVEDELGWSVVELLHQDLGAFPAAVEQVQPVLWAVEVALVAAWQEVGVTPDLCVGHSMGEVAAAYASGALSLADAASVICRRSRLMKRVAGRGAMLVTELGAADAQRLADRHPDLICVAAENAPNSTVLSGAEDILSGIEAELHARQVFCRRVKVNVASHSPLMDELRDDLLSDLGRLRPTRTDVAMFSTVHCAPVTGPELTAAYWVDNLRRPVRFTGAVCDIIRSKESVFVEISPHPVLLASLEESLSLHPGQGAETAVATLRRDADEARELVRAAGRFWAVGGRVDWTRWHADGRRPVPLPAYPWDLSEFRHRQTAAAARPVGTATHLADVPLDSLGLRDWGTGVRMHGIAPVPPSVYVDTLLTAIRDAVPGRSHRLANVVLGTELLDLTDSHDVVLRVTLANDDGTGVRRAGVDALRPGSAKSITCLTADVHEADDADAPDGLRMVDASLGRCNQYASAYGFEAVARRQGYEIGEAFRATDMVWRRKGEAVARMRRPKASTPAAWETGLQPLLAAWPIDQGPYIPLGFDRVEIYADLPEDFWSICTFRSGPADSASADVTLVAPGGQVLAQFAGVRLRRPESGRRRPAAGRAARLSAVLPSANGTLIQRARTLLPRARAPLTAVTRAPRTEAVRAHEPARDDARDGTARKDDREPVGDLVRDTVRDAVRVQAAAILGLPAESLDSRRPLRDYGLDSLMAAQLQLRLRRDCGVDITAGRLLGGESLAALEDDRKM
ncbi:acyltransferase domain-containing protein [Streptomyces sp. NPDC050095]|uniref:type I polyketide synthase n=1 Tax=unclassified Streptomyces TaxID=2593676 RepID=UPI003426D067